MTIEKKNQETKIVKAPPKKAEDGSGEEPKVKVKAAKVKAVPKAKPAKKASAAKVAASETTATEKPARKIPGTPVKKGQGRPPMVNARSKKDVEADRAAKEAEEAKKAAKEAEARAAEEAKKAAEEAEKKQAEEVAASEPADVDVPKDETPAETEPAETEEEKKEEKPAAEKTEEVKESKPEEKPAAKKTTGRTQEIKIIKTAEEQRAEKAASARTERTRTSGKPRTGKPTRRPSNRGSQVMPADSGRRGGSPRRRGDKDRDRERDKFSRLEQRHSQKDLRSLEKKARKKHVKQKQVVEPEVEAEPLPVGTTMVNVPITIAGFCEQVGVSIPSVIMALLKLGVVANQNQTIDEVTVEMIAEEMGIQVVIGQVEAEEEEEGLELEEDRESDLKPRPPIITVMGHVDHGKTSLLDAIRKTNVTEGEAGGITQHIGASEVEIKGKKIVFLDTPGHEAFTAMRARGADITDIAVLVVAADDSVKPQTVESISHAKAASVPIIVAINKMDKPGANPDRVKQDLTEHGIVVEEWGGDVISVPVSAKTGDGIVNLLEMILLQAEVLELKANPDRLAMGSVLEARLDKAKGPVASLLVTNGTLKTGQSIVAGTSAGRIRLMTNHKGETIRKAGPATAVEILGLTDVPAAGDSFNAVSEDRVAKEIAEKRKAKQREEVMAKTSGSSLEELFSQMQEGEVKELNLLVKADVRGSVGAIITSLEKLSDENVKVNIVHSGVGAITESDVTLAGTSGAIIIGFNVRPTAAVTTLADNEGVQIRTYRVIYDIIDDVESAMKGMLDPEFEEKVLGECEVRETFKVPGVGIIAGGYVTSGTIQRNASIRLVRDGVVIHEGVISSLKRFKDDAREVAQGYECGIGIENYNDIKEGDIIECFRMEEVERE